ncbi:glycoside hydrolase family 128 protein [Calocera cornea HHB12733]|uniref:Glycoside hydrolase family 128 protein n=1 Tax=Calocera cornea HHB12733 TaxID=1353952 RepID=A0A165JXB1_9BASI|nr:glycoside hydrolase family 128 protein [Calocera cornea HHB12733]
MARLSLLISLFSLALLASAQAHGAMDRAAHKKRGNCRPKSATSTSTTTTSSTDDSQPTSTSSSAVAVSTPQGSSGGGGDKCGLGWPNGDDGTILSCSGQCSWYHTWSVFPVNVGSALQFAAVFWGPDKADEWDANILNAGTNIAMFFNEPQEPEQSNIDALSAVPYWRTHMQYLKDQHGFRLGSAATSSNPNGIDWTNTFMQACPDCTIDFMCLHWYGTTVDDFTTYVNLWHTTYNRNIWVSEFACQNFVNLDQQCDDVPGFMAGAVAWLDSQDFVEHHAWFGMMRDMQGVNPADGLMNQDGSLSSLGWQYVSS